MNPGSTIRTALGSTASLGDLYDARTDDFCGISIFKKIIPEQAITSADAHFSDIHLVHSDDFSEKVSILDVSSELQVSVLTGLFQLEGSGRYLSDRKSSARTVKSSLIYNIKTKQESVNIYHEDLKDAFAIDAIESGMGTHVVVGISWGANSIVTCQYENRENRDVREIDGNVSAQLKMMSLSISGGKTSTHFNDDEASAQLKYDVRVFGDILNKNEELPTTFQGAVNLMKKLPSLVASNNQGKGKPLSYRLIPIYLLKGYLNISIKAELLLRKIEEGKLVRLVHIFDELSKSHQKLHDFYQDVEEFSYCFTADELKKIFDLKGEMSVEESSFRHELFTTITSIRSGMCDMSCLEAVISNFHRSMLSTQTVSKLLELWSDVMEKINFARPLVQSGAKFIGFGNSLEEVILNDFDSRLVILFFSKAAKVNDPERWGGNRQLFLQEMKKQNQVDKYVVVDLDIHPNLTPKSGPGCVQIIRGGQVMFQDFLSELKRIGKIQFVQSVSGSTRILSKPMRVAPFNIVCPGNTCNPNKVHEWICKRCMEKLEYDLDKHVYCDCGKILVTELEYKCNDQNHGLSFQKHQHLFLFKNLSTIRPCEEINILVVGDGETDMLMWVNALANYCKYESFHDAAANRLRSLLPVDTGHEADFGAMTYQFLVKNVSIRLIIAPKHERDDSDQKINLRVDRYLEFLVSFEKIHAICILVSPDNIQQNDVLAAQIHHLAKSTDKRICRNILFCAATRKDDQCSPKETMFAVRSLVSDLQNAASISVSQKTFFCYDDEAYQLLAKENNQSIFKLSEEEKAQMQNSWGKSTDEAQRMLKQIQTMLAFILNKSLSLESIQKNVEKFIRAVNHAIRMAVVKVVECELEDTEMSWMRNKYVNDVCDWTVSKKYTVEKGLRSAISTRRKNADAYRKELDEMGKAYLFFNHVLTYPNPKIPSDDEVEHMFIGYIMEEENKPGRGNINETIKIVTGLKQVYEKSKRFWYLPQFREMSNSSQSHAPLEPADLRELSAIVKEIFDELLKLEHCGELLQKIVGEKELPKCRMYRSPLSYSEQVEAILNKSMQIKH